MRPAVTRKYEDRSTDRYFCFVFHCDECGASRESERYPYSMRDAPALSEGEENARVMLWKAEHDAAYERANIDAILQFNKCHICGRRVCDDCFSEIDTFCLKCERLKQRGGRRP